MRWKKIPKKIPTNNLFVYGKAAASAAVSHEFLRILHISSIPIRLGLWIWAETVHNQ